MAAEMAQGSLVPMLSLATDLPKESLLSLLSPGLVLVLAVFLEGSAVAGSVVEGSEEDPASDIAAPGCPD